MRENKVFGAYRILVLGISCFLTSIYCARGYGICRPLPLYFHLRNLPQVNKFERDPVSLGFVLIFILIILALQLLVEMEKRKLSREEQMVVQLAFAANRNLEAAHQQLKNDIQLAKKNLSIHQSCSTINAVEHNQQFLNNDALKVTRAICLFGVLPSLIFIVTLSLENINGLRPHVTTTFSLFSYGVIAPSLLFYYNPKLQKFGKNFIKSKWQRLNCAYRKMQIHPIV